MGRIFWGSPGIIERIFIVRAIPLKTGVGEEILRDPLGQNWDFFNPLSRTGIFLIPLGRKTDLFSPPSDKHPPPPPDSFVQFYPPADFTLLGQFFVIFTPLGQLFSPIIPPSDSLF